MASKGQENSLCHLQKSYLAVVGIDFGTTYSGFAFSFNKGQDVERDKIFMNMDWTNEQGSRTNKTPTCLLLNPDQSFNSFGYEAMQKYANLPSDESKEHFFFQNFKMTLHSNEGLNSKTTLLAANGKRLPAKTVFAHSIEFLRDEALTCIRKNTGDDEYKEEDVQWVLTVPAIWTPKAKHFMREAAYEAGIGSPDNPDQLMITLEPEAAALFSMEMKLSDFQSERGSTAVDGVLSQPNTHYIVVDIGGGTLDVAVHEIQDNGTIKEIHMVTGGPYGGMKVNYQFESLLHELFGDERLYEYRKVFPSDWHILIHDFEGKKRGKRALQNDVTRIRLPRSFVSWVDDSRIQGIKRYEAGEIKLYNNEYLCLSPNVMRDLFAPVITSIKEHLNTLLSLPKLSKVKIMLLVGGFADCLLLQHEIKQGISRKCRVLVPRDASVAVVQGAVIFGKKPAKITARVMSTTYGTDCFRDFIEGVHPEENMYFQDGKKYCGGFFACLVKENEIITLRQRIKHSFSPLSANQTAVLFDFYTSKNPQTIFVTETGLTMIGSVTVQSPDTSKGLEREFEVSMYFGGTEITATALDVSSGNIATTTLDFFC